MPQSVDRFRELFERQQQQYEMSQGVPWVEYKRMVVPFGPVKNDYTISADDARLLLSRFSRALLVRWTEGFRQEELGGWYAVVCKAFLDLEKVSANTRSKIRRGLRNCVVARVDARCIANHGYDVFVRAFGRYRRASVPGTSATDFRREILGTRDFDDIVHHWGVFHGDQLIAYARCYLHRPIEVAYATMRYDPHFLRLYPAYALLYRMNQQYLAEEGIEYANNGFRNLSHETHVQHFLIEKFGFQKGYTHLAVMYSPGVSAFLSLTFPFRALLGRLHPTLASAYRLEHIRREGG